ncbi:hypothetical protein [Acinetobacter sp.]|uniref:hypothetical protein n=1 Tax=Acinetobacter sp. TaxID=472 RepID=UPI003D03D8E5
MKYYWVKWKINSHKWYESGQRSHNEFETDELIRNHPIRELIDRRKKYGEEHVADDFPKHRAREDYDLVNWKELTREEFEEFDGWI